MLRIVAVTDGWMHLSLIVEILKQWFIIYKLKHYFTRQTSVLLTRAFLGVCKMKISVDIVINRRVQHRHEIFKNIFLSFINARVT